MFFTYDDGKVGFRVDAVASYHTGRSEETGEIVTEVTLCNNQKFALRGEYLHHAFLCALKEFAFVNSSDMEQDEF